MLLFFRADLHGAFLDCGILSTMTEWLAPLPDKSLPNLLIRQAFLKILGEVKRLLLLLSYFPVN